MRRRPPFILLCLFLALFAVALSALPQKDAKQKQLDGQLFAASRKGNLPAMLKLIRSGADANARGVDGERPLLWAIYGGHVKAMELLLDCGARLEDHTIWGTTPLMAAAGEGDTTSERRVQMVRLLLKRGAKVGTVSGMGSTALFHAASTGDVAVARLLLDVGASPNPSDVRFESPLMRAVDEGHEAVVGLLLQRGAKSDVPNDRGVTPLMVAAGHGRTALVKSLLDRGADPNRKERGGRTALTIAAEEGKDDVVLLLRKSGAKGAAPPRLPADPSRLDLLKRSAKVVQVAEAFLTYEWASPNEVLLWRISQAEENGVTRIDAFTGHIALYDLRRRHEKKLEALSQRLRSTLSSHDSLKIAPGGQWLLWEGARDSVVVSSQDGSEMQSHPISNSRRYWLPGSQQWMVLVWSTQGFYTRAILGDVREPMAERREVPVSKESGIRPLGDDDYTLVLSESRILTPAWRRVDGEPDLREVEILETSLGAKARPRRRLRVKAPAGGEIEEMAFSPDGRRVAWVFSFKRGATASLWTSRLDGSRMRSLGFVRERSPRGFRRPDAPPREVLRSSRPLSQPHSLRWLPNGKRLGYVFGKMLWTVPAQ